MVSGKLVQLRPVETTDLDNWVRWFNNSEVTQYLNTIYPYSYRDAQAYWQKVQANPAEMLYSIVTLEEKIHIGSTSLRHLDWRARNAELAITVGEKDFWGKGYGQDAVRTLCRFGFTEMGLHRIYLSVQAEHHGGLRTYSKVGFQKEGVARQQLYRQGEFHDLIMMGLLAEEFIP